MSLRADTGSLSTRAPFSQNLRPEKLRTTIGTSSGEIPHLVRIYRQRGQIDYNTYGLVATIELARAQGKNPEVPDWQRQSYFAAIQELALLGLSEIDRAKDPEDIRGILSILAIWKGARTYGRFVIDYSEEELLELEDTFHSERRNQPPFVT